MKKIVQGLLMIVTLFFYTAAAAQVDNPVKWKLSTVKISDCEYDLVFSATIDEHWHVYSLNIKGDDGPQASTISLDKSADYEAVGKPTEGKPITVMDKVFEMEVAYFEKAVTFRQRIRLKTDQDITVKGNYAYEACTDEKCTFPPATPFEFKLKGTAACKAADPKGAGAAAANTPCTVDSAAVAKAYGAQHPAADNITAPVKDSALTAGTNASSGTPVSVPANGNPVSESDPWWWIFLSGFGLGFIALFTPCVFPLIPLNVSFFLKRSKSKAQGRFNAVVYALSIVVIFLVLGIGISLIFGAGALNTFSTSAGFNLVLFVLLLIFAASFLGAFEITLPSRFVNKIDQQGDRGGLVGIFFMALALVVVSFSCTGVLIGSALVSAATLGKISGPFWIMFGFSSGLAVPFGFFAFFPAVINSMPKSGGWLNAIKVTLGFLELALAFKFASNADLTYQAGILTREVFIVIWIAIFALMTIYLAGGFKTAHDSDVKFLSVTRLFFVIISFSMTIYLVPGLWGAPLKLLSGVLPPQEYSESPHGFGAGASGPAALDPGLAEFAQYVEVNKNGIVHFKNDYAHALAYAKKTGKPLMIDFTGHACANCRKTEDYIWPDPEVTKRLNNNVVLVSLYVDDKRDLAPEDYQKVFWYGQDRTITTIGDKFKYMEETLYQQSSQPLYVLIDNSEKLLNTPRGYKSGIPEYIRWMDEGINEYKKRTGK